MQTHGPRAHGGFKRAFTLVEILVVVIILGIAGAIIVPSLGSRDDLRAAAAARVIMADLIYAQNLAITNQSNRYCVFNITDQLYSVTDSAGLTIDHPVDHVAYVQKFSSTTGGRNLRDMRLISARFVGISGNEFATVGFDELGTPIVLTPLGASETLTSGVIVVQSGNYRLRVDIEPFTGQISVNPG